jgi:hypothetical protein
MALRPSIPGRRLSSKTTREAHSSNGNPQTASGGVKRDSAEESATSTRRHLVQVLLIAGGAVAGFSGKAALEFYTPQAAADQVRDAAGPREPLSVTAVVEHHDETQGYTWVLPDALPDSVDEPEYPQDGGDSLERWVSRHGGVDLWFTYVKLIIKNTWSEQVSITDIRAVVDRKPPLNGTLLWAPPQGADVLAKFGFNLDDSEPLARAPRVDGAEQIEAGQRDVKALLDRSAYLSEHKIDLAHLERETFDVIAGTTKHYCPFRIRISGLVGERSFSQEVDDHGEPFKVTAPAGYVSSPTLGNLNRNAYRVVYESDDVKWRRTKG